MVGYVVAAADVREGADASGTVMTRRTIDGSVGSERLEQQVVRCGPGRSELDGAGEGREAALFVLGGRGSLLLAGQRHPVEPETAVYVAAGESFAIDNPGPDGVEIVAVSCPESAGASATEAPATVGTRRVTLSLAAQVPHHATTEREFRYLVHPEVGCRSLTQFVGTIPPGRAPTHYHLYDEVVYVLDGEGTVRIGGTEAPLGAGTCVHLPPRQPHSLENTGAGYMRVLGVFTPAGDPSEAYEARPRYGGPDEGGVA